ncbi:MAG TPA: hypothetical protein VMV46_06565 [Thermoanaerobaculia bacterium]|nr:hypothetical protein [Thermoanaerobaculia bacterium]
MPANVPSPSARRVPSRSPVARRARRPSAALAWIVLLGCSAPEPTSPLPETVELRLVEDARGRPVAVDAAGLPAEALERLRQAPGTVVDWTEVFPVTPVSDSDDAADPLPGSYRLAGDAVRFLPREPFARGRSYRARWNGADGEADIELSFEPARQGARPSTQVATLYPSADLVPANLARVHILFTAPMTPGKAADHVLLERENGVALAAFAREEATAAEAPATLLEAWTEDRTRVTLQLAADASGRPPLEVAGRYRLVVDAGWPDAEGVPLRDGFEKVFAVAEPDRQGPDPQSWTLTPPVSAGAPLTLDAPAPLDHVSLERSLEVVSQEEIVEGTVRIANDERRWVFSPRRPWTNGSYVVRVLAGLEDPAGNRLDGETGATVGGTATVLPFRVEIETPRVRRRGDAGS